MDEKIRRRKRRRAKRIIKAWCARAAVLLVFGLIIAGIIWAIHSIAAKSQGNETYAAEAENAEKVTETEEITTEETAKASLKFQDQHSMDWDAADDYLLAKIAMAEAEGEGVEGKAMVIMVVLNRVWASGFENTIEGVIMEHHTNSKGSEVYQFTPVAPGGRWYSVEPDEECYEALRMIKEEGWDESEGALFFESIWNDETWHRENLEYIKTVGNQNFYK